MSIFFSWGHKFAEGNESQKMFNGPTRAKKINGMNSLRNRVQLIGNLGMNPQIKIMESGSKLAKFTLATNETYTNASGEKVTETEWHQVVAWNKTADLIESYLQKGKEVALEGKLVTRSWEDSNGVKKYTTEVVCSEVLFLGPRD
jgi:single-strand DNA-binding protein